MDPVRHRETIALWDIIPRGTPMPHRGTKSHRIPRYVARATPAAAAANAIGRPLRWNGYSASARRYLTCASASDVERVDIFGINVYRWCRRGLALQRTKQVAAYTTNCNVQNRLQRTPLRWCNLQQVAACWPALYGCSAGAGEGLAPAQRWLCTGAAADRIARDRSCRVGSPSRAGYHAVWDTVPCAMLRVCMYRDMYIHIYV